MRAEFVAGTVGVAHEDNVLIIGFADDETCGHHCLIVQRAVSTTGDPLPGNDEHLQWESDDPPVYWAGDNAIEVIHLSRESVEVRLRPSAARAAGLHAITAKLRISDGDFHKLRAGLRQAFKADERFTE